MVSGLQSVVHQGLQITTDQAKIQQETSRGKWRSENVHTVFIYNEEEENQKSFPNGYP